MVLCLLIFLLCLCFPEITGSGIKNGLTLIAGQVLPALYPFILLTTLFKHLAGRSSKYRFLPVFIGFLSGYPLGAKTAADFDLTPGKIPAQSLLLICNNPSPAYMISFVGLHCLKSPSLGIQMYMSILIGNLLTGLACIVSKKLSPLKETFCQTQVLPVTSENLLDQVIHDTFLIVLNVASCILFFSVAAAFIQKLIFLPPAIQGLFAGMLEMTTGIQMLTAQSFTLKLKILLMTGIISFGGLSVIVQTKSMISESSLSLKKYIAEKAIACTIAVFIMYLFIHIH